MSNVTSTMTTTRKSTITTGRSLSNYTGTARRGPLNSIHVNPRVTREGQRELAARLHAEIASDRELEESFRRRPVSVKARDDSLNSARIFNDFCVSFIDQSKDTKDRVVGALSEANHRLKQLEQAREHLEEIERRNYRFEMDLPEEYVPPEEEIRRAIAENMRDDS